jgi:putative ABC transport system permease protein
VTAAAGRAGVTLSTVTRAERAEQLRADPLVLGLRRLLQALLGICAAVVLAALVLADAVAARARRGELAALRAVGMSTGQVRRTAGAEQVLVVGTIVLLGVALGGLLAPLVLPALLGPLVLPSPGGPDPAAVTVQAAERAAAPWPAVLALGVAVVLAGLGSALLRSRRVARMDVPGVLREGVR